jgi:hypothetical protein
MEFLKNVLIKEINGHSNGDKVVYVDNLPKDLLYRRTKKLFIDPNDVQQRMVPEYVLVDGKKVPTNAFTDELLPGIERSQTGDAAYCFFLQYNEAKDALMKIDHYIKTNVPVMERVQERVYYAAQPGVMTSGTIPLSAIPRIVLPEPVSPPSKDVQEPVANADALTPAPRRVRRPMTEEQKEEARKRMARAREVKALGKSNA